MWHMHWDNIMLTHWWWNLPFRKWYFIICCESELGPMCLYVHSVPFDFVYNFCRKQKRWWWLWWWWHFCPHVTYSIISMRMKEANDCRLIANEGWWMPWTVFLFVLNSTPHATIPSTNCQQIGRSSLCATQKANRLQRTRRERTEIGLINLIMTRMKWMSMRKKRIVCQIPVLTCGKPRNVRLRLGMPFQVMKRVRECRMCGSTACATSAHFLFVPCG